MLILIRRNAMELVGEVAFDTTGPGVGSTAVPDLGVLVVGDMGPLQSIDWWSNRDTLPLRFVARKELEFGCMGVAVPVARGRCRDKSSRRRPEHWTHMVASVDTKRLRDRRRFVLPGCVAHTFSLVAPRAFCHSSEPQSTIWREGQAKYLAIRSVLEWHRSQG